jgi:hypothetical protein
MAIEYTNLFHSRGLRNLPKLEFLVGKYTIWQPCPRGYTVKFIETVLLLFRTRASNACYYVHPFDTQVFAVWGWGENVLMGRVTR